VIYPPFLPPRYIYNLGKHYNFSKKEKERKRKRKRKKEKERKQKTKNKGKPAAKMHVCTNDMK